MLGQMQLVLYFPPSPRHVSAAQAKELIQHVPAYVQTGWAFCEYNCG